MRCLLPTSGCRVLRAQVSNSSQSQIANRQYHGGGEGIRTPDPMVANHVLCQLSYTPNKRLRNSECGISNPQSSICNPHSQGWLRGRDLNSRPLGYEPNELPDCSTTRQWSTHSQ